MFDYPPNGLVERGVRHFVYPTMWFSEIPYLSGELTKANKSKICSGIMNATVEPPNKMKCVNLWSE